MFSQNTYIITTMSHERHGVLNHKKPLVHNQVETNNNDSIELHITDPLCAEPTGDR